MKQSGIQQTSILFSVVFSILFVATTLSAAYAFYSAVESYYLIRTATTLVDSQYGSGALPYCAIKD